MSTQSSERSEQAVDVVRDAATAPLSARVNERDNEIVLNNAHLVLPDEIVVGSVCLRGGRIASIDSGRSDRGLDLDGDYLIPGIVELHTDHLETHFRPRPGVSWPMDAAIQAHDAQIATAGITTVFDCLRLGGDSVDRFEPGEMRAMADALAAAGERGVLRAEHRLHLRCEVSADDVLTDFADFEGDANVGLVSLMDHAPGQRQFATVDAAASYYRNSLGLDEDAFQRFVEERQSNSRTYAERHRAHLAAFGSAHGIALASHDDANADHVDEALAHGVTIAEFPTSIEAARHAHAQGMAVLMGAPNVVRGRSHSGNVSARELAAAGVLDLLSSDYVPISLLQSVFLLSFDLELLSLPDAVALVTGNPARVLGLGDRGQIATGLRADLVRVHRSGSATAPVVRSVWRGGRRVA